MKICLLTTSFPRHAEDDAGIFIARLMQALSEQEIQGIIIRPDDSKYQSSNRFLDWEVCAFKYGIFCKSGLAYGSGILPNIKANPLLLFQIPMLLAGFFTSCLRKARNADVIHANWIATAIPGILAAKIISKPVVVTIRGEDLKLLDIPIIGILLKAILNYSNVITTVSELFRDRLQSVFPDKQIAFTPNGVAGVEPNLQKLDLIKAELGLQATDYVVFAGRLIALKRIDILIEILARLEQRSLKLVLCGALNDLAYVESLRKLAEKLGVLDRVVFAGQIAPDKYMQLLSGAKQYWSASEYEGRPNGVLEALAQAVPCILSKIEAHRALVTDLENGFLFEEHRLSDLCKQVDLALTDKVLAQTLSANAKKSVAQQSWESSACKYVSIYKELCERRVD